MISFQIFLWFDTKKKHNANFSSLLNIEFTLQSIFLHVLSI